MLGMSLATGDRNSFPLVYRTANYVLFLLFGVVHISLVAIYSKVHFLGSALTFMMAYVWGRRNEDVRVRGLWRPLLG